MVRIPLYRETSRAHIINLITRKVTGISEKAYEIHLDVYQMATESLHIILFELLMLRKLHVGMREFVSVPSFVNIYVEVSNTFNNTLCKSLKYLERFEGIVRLLPIEAKDIDISNDRESDIQFVARYLDSMERNALSKEQNPNKGNCIHATRA